jgi:hypothetical protein
LNATLNARFRSGPWTADVKPAEADHVNGVEVVERLVTRSDRPGAVVRLATGQLAVIGESFAVGAPRMLKLWASRRIARATAPAERAWWTQVRQAVTG